MTYLLSVTDKRVTFATINNLTVRPMLRLPPFAGCAVLTLLLLIATALTSDAQQKGKASYYSRRANGARTSSGVRLNNDSLVCAHRTHPFGTLLNVKNPANGKEVVVKVIDRGPHIRGRVIDLSYEAARQLGILAAGVALVEVSVHEELNVPFKSEKGSQTELDLELPAPEDGFDLQPEWQRGREKGIKDTPQHSADKTEAAKHNRTLRKKTTKKQR